MGHEAKDESATYSFCPAELARLAAYKAAIAAGFFSETCAETPTINVVAPGLSNADFKRLVAYKHAVQAGLYSEFPVSI